jgi:hypothetical protein
MRHLVQGPLIRVLLLACLWLPTLATGSERACPIALDTPFPGWQPDPVRQDHDWLSLYTTCLPPLRHARGNRWPLIFWQGIGDEPLQPTQVQALLARGVVQHLPLDVRAIPAARALQAAGAPVIIMQGQAWDWPYGLLDDDTWRLPLHEPQRFSPMASVQADPTRLDAWQLGAAQIRDTLRAFRAAGVEVDAVWLDYEAQPLLLDLQTVRAAENIAGSIPAEALADEAAFALYRRRLYLQLVDAYIAAPIREVYPDALSTNWIVTLSTPDVPVLSWDNWHHPQVVTGFSATNPIAYGIDTALLALVGDHPPADQAALDRLYLHVLLRQVSADAWNRHRQRSAQVAVPWVARRVQDEQQPTPAMSRAAYREGLRHLWLRGIAAMQVFNPAADGHAWRRALAEAQDAQHVYDEMLLAGDLLQRGEVMNYRVPLPGEAVLLWSGLRDDRRAVLRVTRNGSRRTSLLLQPWPGEVVLLPAPPEGASYLLTRGEGRIETRVLSRGDGPARR